VGSYPANKFGLYDMHGNVNEWCWDYYGLYDLTQTDNPTGAAAGTRHIYRGGGRFGQSLTAIAKLAPDADMGEGLAINYSGGESMPQDVSGWLDSNGIQRK
jgi:hypothetical protein